MPGVLHLTEQLLWWTEHLSITGSCKSYRLSYFFMLGGLEPNVCIPGQASFGARSTSKHVLSHFTTAVCSFERRLFFLYTRVHLAHFGMLEHLSIDYSLKSTWKSLCIILLELLVAFLKSTWLFFKPTFHKYSWLKIWRDFPVQVMLCLLIPDTHLQ